MTLARMFAPAVIAAGLGSAALMAPSAASAQSADELVRVLVNVADVVMRGGQPYYRYGDYGYDDRLIVQRDRYGNPVYYRMAPRGGYDAGYRNGPPYGNAYGYYRNGPVTAGQRNVKCNKHGKCKVEYYDPRYDRSGYGGNRYWDGRRWRHR